MNRNQFDFALDADDPSTAQQAAFMVTPPFSKDLTVKSLDTQKSFLITDIRLRSMARQDETSIYGIDRWAVDVYHKLAGYESAPGVNTRVVDNMGHDVYDRYDNRTITPDTPVQKTTYNLSAREVDLLIHAGAYDDPANAEASLRKQLVGQTWSMPDQVQVSESRIRIPDMKSVVSTTPQVNGHSNEFTVALVRDTGQKAAIDAHTPGSNMALVMDTALRTLTPGVTPMADIHKDLQAASDVKASSKQHQVKSQVLDSELDFDDAPSANDELDFVNMQSTPEVDQSKSQQITMAPDDASDYREDLTVGAEQKADVQEEDVSADDEMSQQTVKDDQAQINQFLPEDQESTPVNTRKRNQQQLVQNQERNEVHHADFNAGLADEDYGLNDEEESQLDTESQITSPATDERPVTSNKKQQRQRIVRTTESQAVQQTQPAQVQTPVEQPMAQDTGNGQVFDASQAQRPSFDQLQSMLNDLKKEGYASQYQAPDYDEAAKNSPAAQRERLKVQQRLRAQESAAQAKASAAAVQQKQSRPRTNVPKFDGGPDF